MRTPAVHSISEKKVNTIDIERILQLFVLRNVSLRAKGECGLVVEVDKVTNRKDVIKIVRRFKLITPSDLTQQSEMTTMAIFTSTSGLAADSLYYLKEGLDVNKTRKIFLRFTSVNYRRGLQCFALDYIL